MTTPAPLSGPAPQTVLAKAGLELPGEASDVSVEQQDRPPYRESYLLRLRLPLDAARSWCTTGGLGGAGVIAGLTTQDKTFLGQSSAAAGSLLCTASWPQDVSWQRIVLIEPEGDASSGAASTQVTAAIYQMPVH